MRVPRFGAGLAVALTTLLVLPRPASAATIHVPGDQLTIAAGLQAATSGDTVLVACGLYFERGLDLVSGVTLLSETGLPDCVTIDGQGRGRILFGGGLNSATVVEGITFTNGFDDQGPDHRRPGTPLTPGPADVRTLLAPDADLGGGGALYAGSSQLTVRHCDFVGNQAAVNGGAVRVEVGSVTFEGCTFDNNLCDNQGGAIYVGDGAGAVITGCVFEANQAEQAGAVQATRNSSVTVTDSEFRENTATRTAGLGSGGAISASFCSPQITGCFFWANTAGLRGGALAAFAGSPTVIGCTLVANYAPEASAILAHTSDYVVTNTLIALHTGPAPVACTPGSVTLSCSDVWGNQGGDYVGCLAGQDAVSGNLNVDPQFCSPVAGVFSLQGTSPCLPANNSCGVQMGALGSESCPGTVPLTLITNPVGLNVTVNGVSFTAPAVVNVLPGVDLTVSTPSSQSPVPDVQNDFVDWSDGGGQTHVINIAGPTTLTANFATSYRLSVTADAGGTATPATSFHPAGASVAIAAAPDPGFGFDGWTGTGAGSYTGPNPTATVTMSAPVTEHAGFSVSNAFYTLTMTAGPNGSVLPATSIHSAGAQVQITAVPDSGYAFAGWSGAGFGSYTGLNNPAIVTMNADITESATFAPVQDYTLTMVADPGGTVSPASGLFPGGLPVQISATADTGWVFDGWEGIGAGSYTGPSALAAVTMLGDITQTGHFSFPATHPLTMQVGSGGTVSPASGDYPNGQSLQITATPDPGYIFVGWAGNGLGSYTGSANPATVTMWAPLYETVTFAPVGPVTVTTVPPGKRIGVDGVDYVSPQTFEWIVGSQHTLDVDALIPGLPGEQEVFTQWENGSASPLRTYVVASASAVTLTAIYEQQYFLDFQDPPEGFSTPGPGWQAAGSTVSIQATPNPTHTFIHWTGVGPGSYTGGLNPATVTMNGPITQTPNFGGLGYEFTISASATDPHVNQDVSAGGARFLYLWLSCTDAGISAFEADVTGDLPVLAFTPQPGILNAKSPTSLLLAFAGCPGASGPLLVGEFFVQDSGGTLCLGPSASSGKLTAVDCVAFVEVDPVQVTGFTSAGGSPCFVPGAACLTGTPIATATITTVPPGKRIGVDGTDYVSPQTFTWNLGSQHVIDVDDGVDGAPGSREQFVQWEDGSTALSRVVTAQLSAPTFAATYESQHFLDFQDPPEGTSTPGDGWYAEGAAVSIQATGIPPYVFTDWVGTGNGSYTGPNNPASVTVNGPIVQVPVFGTGNVTITTTPPGKRIGVDGTDYTSPAMFTWAPGSAHAWEVDSLVAGVPGAREEFVQWEDGSTSTVRGVFAPLGTVTYDATYEQQYFLDFQDPPEGTSSPGDGWVAAGTAVSILATPSTGHVFQQWTGTGPGSYTGTSNPAGITMNGPITQAPGFSSLGYEFTLSASATDPSVNTDAPAGGIRPVYLWMSCTDTGLSAFQADVTGDLPVLGFTPESGVLNAGSPTALLLAVGNCPGPGAPFLLGSLLVQDDGGDLCLGPAATTGNLTAVECVQFTETDSVQATGFSTSGAGPCFTPGRSCLTGVATTIAAAAEERHIAVTWDRPAIAGNLAYHVYRADDPDGPFRRVTASPVTGGTAFRDAGVNGTTNYHYKVTAVVNGSEGVLGDATVMTPDWKPLVNGFAGPRPNPFGGATDFHFTIARDMPVQLSIYDVAGRLVLRLADERMAAGEYRISWDGRNGGGRRVPPGVYFSRIQTEEFTESRKVVRID